MRAFVLCLKAISIFMVGLSSISVLNAQSSIPPSDLNTIPANDSIKWDTFNSTQLGLSIEYPSSWDVHERQSRFEQGTDLNIASPGFSDPFSGQFDISVIDKVPIANVMVLTNIFIDQLVVDYFDVDYEKRLIEDTNLTRYVIDGERAGSFVSVLQGKEDDLTLGAASEVVVTVHNGIGYVLQFLNSAENFDTPMTTGIREHMFNSIEWLN